MQSVPSFISVKHYPNLGDQIAVLPACKTLFEKTGKPVKFCQQINTPAAYYQGATHPTMNESIMVTMNQEMFDMMKPLMESQEYIHSYEVYMGQPIDIDFDTIRGTTYVGMPNLMIQSWIMFAYPDLAIDLSKQWMFLEGKCPPEIKEQVHGKIILNFTERYRNHLIDYNFLREYAADLIFAGTEREHWLFCQRWQLNIPRLQVSNFLEYAYAIKGSRFIMGCQTFGWNLAQAFHHPRIVELCSYAPNVQPYIGDNSFGYFHITAAKYYFNLLHRKTLLELGNKKAPLKKGALKKKKSSLGVRQRVKR